ncbi:12706_t:CDS:1, partial [Acaulospora morrowiae]
TKLTNKNPKNNDLGDELQNPSLPNNFNFSQTAFSPQQCLSFAIKCRDVQCAFEDFDVTCDQNLGPI